MLYMKKLSKFIIPLISAAVLIGIDQLTKYLVDTKMQLHGAIPIIKDVFELHYIQNSGTAWGMFAGMDMHYVFIALTAFLSLVIILAYVRFSAYPHLGPLNIFLVILFSGAVGNLIDRIRLHYVIDFLYFKLINFPVFNVADIYVVVSMFALGYLLIFKYQEEDFDFSGQRDVK